MNFTIEMMNSYKFFRLNTLILYALFKSNMFCEEIVNTYWCVQKLILDCSIFTTGVIQILLHTHDARERMFLCQVRTDFT